MPPTMPSLLFPSVGFQVVSCLVHFLGVSVLSHCISRRLASEKLTSLRGLRQMTWPRLCILLVFIDSWLFLFSSGVLIFGIGLELHHSICSAAIYLCIGFYATSKILIYAFLIERVHIVWLPSAGVNFRRFKSKVYIICFVTVSLYSVIIALLLVGRVYFLREGDSACVIGLKSISSIPLLAYDLYINIFLTSLFLFPILKKSTKNARVRRIARRALLAAVVALTTSTANILILALRSGEELGWVCLGSCGADVILNALALFWVTGTRKARPMSTTMVSDHRGILKYSSPNGSPSGTASRPTQSIPPVPVPPIPQITVRPPTARPTPAPSLHTPAARSNPSLHARYPENPFARPTFIPKNPEPEIRISANPPDPATKSDSPSTLQSLIGLFRKDPPVDTETDIQITVTREFEIEDHGLIGRLSDIESCNTHEAS